VRLALVANHRSGAGLAPARLARLMTDLGAEVSDFAISDLEKIPDGGFERIAVAGGDGSIGPVAELAGRLGIPMAVIPAGTANDFTRAHDLPTDPEAAARLAVQGEQIRTLELGRLDGRPFVNVVSAGLSPEAARRASAHKSRLGPLAYALGAVQAGVTARPVPCAVQVDGRTLHAGQAWQIIVSVSGAFGGGSHVDEADPGDGVLHVTVVPAGSRIGLVRRAIGMRRGTIAGQPGVPSAEGRVIELGLRGGAQLNLDGELCTPGRLTVDPAAFRLVAG